MWVTRVDVNNSSPGSYLAFGVALYERPITIVLGSLQARLVGRIESFTDGGKWSIATYHYLETITTTQHCVHYFNLARRATTLGSRTGEFAGYAGQAPTGNDFP